MRITVTKIARWAGKRKAQASLPRLVRRLAQTVGRPTQSAIPAGDSIGLPGWDGELVSEEGSAWVPKGKSFWEFSCDANPTTKANKDYNKRTTQTSKKDRARATIVVLTARRWPQKARWLKAKQREKKWANVRAYDADDLEQWLEQSPPGALDFAEELGLIGTGVEGIETYWKGWSQQSNPAISTQALFIDRPAANDRFIAELRGHIQAGRAEISPLKADSVGEAVAFACASIMAHPELLAHALVVTSVDGWRFVQKNPSTKIAIAAEPEIAERPTMRNGLVVVIPYAAGDQAGYYQGAAARTQGVKIERPRIHEFEKALTLMELEASEAKRLAGITGRSWSIFRRHHAVNPAIRRPKWLDIPQAQVLSTLCLFGGWSAAQPGDRDIVSGLSGRLYEEVERDLRYLSQLDDAPVVSIGNIWKSKSPLELLYLFGDRITRGELDRFFELVRNILLTPDPVLELPEQDRFAAALYGNVRAQSALLIDAACDTLIKLSVGGSQVAALSAANIEARVATFIRALLESADEKRWLSLSSVLPSLAEAAPDEFLRAVELSLTRSDPPVARLMTETSDSALMGKCWHAGLLWALETLAWAPDRLMRVTLILARLSSVKIKGNWGNTPKASLLNIFRSWLPQTAADVDQRLAVLDTLITKEPDVAFDLLDGLVHDGRDVAHPSMRPSWRDDDAGAGRGVAHGEDVKMWLGAADRLITSLKGNARRIARIIPKLGVFDKDRTATILEMADEFTKSDAVDEDKQVIRDALRKRISRLKNYTANSGTGQSSKLEEVQKIYERLSPADLVIRHRWLFETGWPELPTGRDKDHKKRILLVESLRIEALREIHRQFAIEGVERLALACPGENTVGAALAKIDVDTAALGQWICDSGGDFSNRQPISMTIRSLLHVSKDELSVALIRIVLEEGKKKGWDSLQTARFLALAPERRSTWDIVGSCGPEVEKAYWSIAQPFWLEDNNDCDFAVRNLIKAARPRTALQVCHFDVKRVDPELLTEILERMLMGEEPEGHLVESYHIGEALEHLETSGRIDKSRLARLEFGLIPVLGYEGEQQAQALYDALVSDPEVFCELLSILYPPAGGSRDEWQLSELRKKAAGVAWRVFRNCRRQPGTKRDGTVDRDAFVKFIDDARDLSRRADRLKACDLTLGGILAHAPRDSKGIWPSEPARDILERAELGDMRRGFLIGSYNARGFTSRAHDEGGAQERKLADEYRVHASALRNSHPNVAAAIDELIRRYERKGVQQDLEAELHREGVWV